MRRQRKKGPAKPKARQSGKLTKAQQVRLIIRQFNPGDLLAYYNTQHWKAKKVEAEKAWRELLRVPEFGQVPCLLCGKDHQQWHHVPEGYKNLFREHPIKHLRPFCTRCHRHHHRK